MGRVCSIATQTAPETVIRGLGNKMLPKKNQHKETIGLKQEKANKIAVKKR